MNELPVAPVVIVWTVPKSLEGPSFNKIVTGPEAFAHFNSNGVPALTLTKSAATLVNCAALATATAAPATRTLENCILKVMKVLVVKERTKSNCEKAS